MSDAPETLELPHSTVSKNGHGGNGKILLDHHREQLEMESAISPSVIEQRGYFSITSPSEAKELGFSHRQASTVSADYPALIIPYYNTSGQVAVHCMRPDAPRSIDLKKKKKLPDGTYPQKVLKYEMPRGSGNILDCHPAIIGALADPGTPLFFTEGAKKADALIAKGYVAININGVYGWRGTNKKQGKTALSDFEDIALAGRDIILLFDSDIRTNANVKGALRRFKAFLEGKKAFVIPVLLPPSEDGKTGVDDWFASGKTATDLDQLINYFSVFSPDLGQSRKRNWTTEEIIDTYEDWNYRFALNDMNDTIEVNGERFTDTRENILQARLRDEGIPVTHGLNAIHVMGNKNRYHPLKAYLESLEWDGGDHIKLLATYFADKEGMFPTWLRRWLIGAVAKVMSDGASQNFMLVLATEADDKRGQGKGKSYFTRWICPLDRYFTEAYINPESKDCRLNLIRYWIWEAGELGAITRKADREALKSFISMQTVEDRMSYGKYNTEKPAVTSFIGTINDEGGGFLNDPTGSRRYVVSTITGIDWDYIGLDKNQIWAQAYHLYKSGEPWMLTEDEQNQRDQVNAAYQVEEPMESLVLTKFEIDSEKRDNQFWWLTSAEILEHLELDPTHRGLVTRLASVLKREGLEKTNQVVAERPRKKRVKGRYWQGIKIRNQ